MERVNCPACTGSAESLHPRFTLKAVGATTCVLCGTTVQGATRFGDSTVTPDVAVAYRFEGFNGVLQIPIDEWTKTRIKKYLGMKTGNSDHYAL